MKEINGDDIEVLRAYLSVFLIIQERIKNKKLFSYDLIVTEKQLNSIEKPIKKHFYHNNENIAIPLILEDEYSGSTEICNIELEYVKYFDEYNVEHNVKVQKLSEILEKF
jgi:hypothetical protein